MNPGPRVHVPLLFALTFLWLVPGCACRVVEVVAGERLVGPAETALPPSYLRISGLDASGGTPRPSDRRAGGAYAVFDVAWTDGTTDDGVQVVVQSEGSRQLYAPDGAGEDLSLGSTEADMRWMTSVLWASGGASSWTVNPLWELPIVETGLRPGQELEPIRRRRLLENAGILLLTIDPLLSTLIPWAVEWVRERPISLFLALDAEQRAALNSRSVVKLMTSLVDWEFGRAKDLGFGRTQVPVRIGVEDIDFAVGQVTLFESADGAELTLGVESLTLNIDESRRVELRLAGFGAAWPIGLSDRVFGDVDPSAEDWPVSIGGDVFIPDVDRLQKLEVEGISGPIEHFTANRFASIGGEDALVVDLDQPGARPLVALRATQVLDIAWQPSDSDSGLLSVVTVAREESRSPIVHVFRVEDERVQNLTRVPGQEIERVELEGDRALGDKIYRLVYRLSPRGDSFVVPDGAFLALLRSSAGGVGLVDRFPAEEAVADFIDEGRSLLWRSKSALRLIEVASGEVLLNQSQVSDIIVGSDNFALLDDDGFVRVFGADGEQRFAQNLGGVRPTLIDDKFELCWAIGDDRVLEIDFDDEESTLVSPGFRPTSVAQFEDHILVRGDRDGRPMSLVRKVDTDAQPAGRFFDGRDVFGLILGSDASSSDDYHAFSVEPVAGEQEATVWMEHFDRGERGEPVEVGKINRFFGGGRSTRFEVASFSGRTSCRPLEDDRCLIQVGTELWVLQLGGEMRWQIQLPYRARNESRPAVLRAPEWILFSREGKTHALSMAELVRFAESVLSEPDAPIVLEAFPGLRPVEMVKRLP